VAAPEQTLEALVKDELRGPVSELVRRLVPELVREQLSGYAGAHQLPQEATNGSTATADPPRAVEASTRHCKGCDRELALDQFSPGHYRCRECRRREQRERDARRREASEDEPAGLPV
jgi:hypothetical protein